MAIVQAIRSLLLDPRIREVDIDSPEALELHRQITIEKPLMREVFRDFYTVCVDLAKLHLTMSGKQVEIGAGGSSFKEYYPQVLTTDVKPSIYLDMVVNAQDMPFDKEAVGVVYGINCFHHLNDPRRFFSELGRVLIRGGGCVLIEPYNTWLSRRFHSNIHSHEHFNQDQRTWEAASNSGGPLSGANQALSHIVFWRDRAQFEREFSFLEIVSTQPMTNYLRYILSGGVNFRQVVPNAAGTALRGMEFVLRPFSRLLALHHVVVLRKNIR